MPVLDQARLVEMSQELLRMSAQGVQAKRLGRIALDLMVGEAAVRAVLRGAEGPQRAWAKRALAFLRRLEAQTVRLHARTLARERMARTPLLGVGLEVVPG